MFPMQVRAVRVTKRVHEAYFAQLYLSKVFVMLSSPILKPHKKIPRRFVEPLQEFVFSNVWKCAAPSKVCALCGNCY
jgi:hypothetical protein